MDGHAPWIIGHAAVFNSLSKDLGGFREIIAPGAFAGHETSDIRALFNHDPNMVLGRNKAGTLRMKEDAKGLHIEIDPPNTSYADDLLESMRRGDIDQCSFGFRTISDSWARKEGEDVRTLEKVELFDVSPVVFAAYTDTDVAVRSLKAWRGSSSKGRRLGASGLGVREAALRLAELDDMPTPQREPKRTPPRRTGQRLTVAQARARIDAASEESKPAAPAVQVHYPTALEIMDQDFERKRYALHEAGHAIANHFDGSGIDFVELDSRGGRCRALHADRMTAAGSMAGVVAEEFFSPRKITVEPSALDMRVATRRAEQELGWRPKATGHGWWPQDDRRLRSQLDLYRRAARELIRYHRKAVSAIAESLMKRRRLSGGEVANIIQRNA